MRRMMLRRAGLGVWVSLFVLPMIVWGEGNTTLSGFVDTSFFYENLQNTNTFSLDEVELDVQSALTSWAGLRTDINFRAVDSSSSTTDVGGVSIEL